MARLPAITTLFALLLTLLNSTHALRSNAGKPANAILLSSIKTLTLHAEKPTSNRRVPAIPQLQCVGGNARGLYSVDLMRCKNAGSGYDSEDIEWTCQASLPEEFKLGGTEVVCEGYESAEDPWVLKGSCGVEYRLVLTEKGEERYADSLGWGMGSGGVGQGKMGGLFTVLFWAAFVGIIGLIVYRFFYPDPAARGLPNRRGGYRGGDGWGGDGNDNDDPPPPYTPRYTAAQKQQSANRSYASGSRNANAAGGFQPGFWTGTAAGAAAAAGANYMMAGNNRNANRQLPPQAGPSNWFGGGGAGQRSPSHGGYGGGAFSSNVTPSSSRHESTGFGGTRRR